MKSLLACLSLSPFNILKFLFEAKLANRERREKGRERGESVLQMAAILNYSIPGKKMTFHQSNGNKVSNFVRICRKLEEAYFSRVVVKIQEHAGTESIDKYHTCKKYGSSVVRCFGLSYPLNACKSLRACLPATTIEFL